MPVLDSLAIAPGHPSKRVTAISVGSSSEPTTGISPLRTSALLQPYFSPASTDRRAYCEQSRLRPLPNSTSALLPLYFSPTSALLQPCFSRSPSVPERPAAFGRTQTLLQPYFRSTRAILQYYFSITSSLRQPIAEPNTGRRAVGRAQALLPLYFALLPLYFALLPLYFDLLPLYYSPTSALRTSALLQHYFSPTSVLLRPIAGRT